MKHTDLAVDYFERHSTSNECHITSDGRVFHAIGNAISFANEHNLQDQTIESYTRGQIEQKEELPFTAEIDTTDVENSLDVINKVSEGAEDGNTTEDDTSENKTESEILEQEKIEENQVSLKESDLSGFDSPAGQIALNVFLAANDVEEIEYKDLKALVKHFDIETADQKAETLKKALTEFKNNLAQ